MPYFSGFMAVSAFIITLFSAAYCNFITFTSEEGGESPVVLHYGIWWYRGWAAVQTSEGTYLLETCYSYDEDTEIDPKWKTARAFNTMAIIIGCLASFWTMCAGCLKPSKRMFQVTGVLYMAVCFFTGMSLLMLESNACKANENVEEFKDTFRALNLTFGETCSIGPGSKSVIAATVLWFVAAIASCKSEPFQESPNGEGGDDRVSPDGKEESVPTPDGKEESVPAGEIPEQAA